MKRYLNLKRTLFLRRILVTSLLLLLLLGIRSKALAQMNGALKTISDQTTRLHCDQEPQAVAPEPSNTSSEIDNTRKFSIIWLSDTQSMAYSNPDALAIMGEWIRSTYQEHRVQLVIQTGDAVDNGFKPEQWKNFDLCYMQFSDVLPYFAIAGNHDLGVKRQDYAAYLARENVRAIPRAYSFEGGKGAYRILHIEGVKFLFLGLGWGAEEQAVDWANATLRLHTDAVAILLLHSYIKADGSYTRIGKAMYDKVVSQNTNVRLVLSGHVRGTGALVEEIDDDADGVADRCVTAMIYNYQHFDENCGQIRMLTFDLDQRSLEVQTFSPYTNRFYPDDYFQCATFMIEQAF